MVFSPLPDFCPTCDTTIPVSDETPNPLDKNSVFEIPVSLVDGTQQTTCEACGGGAAGGIRAGGGISMMLQGHFSAAPFGGLAGPGMFLDYYMPTYIAAGHEDGNKVGIRMFMPSLGRAVTLTDGYNRTAGTNTGSIDGIMEGKYGVFNSVKLVNGSGSTVSILNSATQLLVTKLDGTLLTFDLYDTDGDQELDSYARLKTIENRCGETLLTITYDTGKGVPKTVTDRYGNVATYVYGQTIAGQPALTSVTYKGVTCTLTYANDFVSNVSYGSGGGSYGCGLTQDPISQTTAVSVTNASGSTNKYRLTQDYITYEDSLINQPVNVLRSISDVNDHNIYSIYFNPSNASEARVLLAGDKLLLYHNDEFSRYLAYYSQYTVGNLNDGWSAFTNLVLESTYWRHDYPPTIGGSEQELAFGSSPVLKMPTGEEITRTFGPRGHIEMQEYEDGTYETWQYDAWYNITRHRDRNGHVTKMIRDTCGRLTERRVGIKDTGTKTAPIDVNQPEYAVYKYAYHTSGNGKGQIKTEFTARWTNETDMYRTDYAYDSNDRLITVTESADVASGTRPVTTYTYDVTFGRLKTSKDPVNSVVTYLYDSFGRNFKVEYNDTSTEIKYYGGSGAEQRPEKIKARDGSVTKREYDSLGRLKKVIRGYSKINSSGTETVNNDALTKSVTEYFYVGNTPKIDYQVSDGKKTSYVYDFKDRVVETSVYPYAGKTLTNKTVYVDNRVFYSEDPYGRRQYMGYSASNTTEKIRTISCTVPANVYANNSAVLAASRSNSLNAPFVIVDAIKDGNGNLTEFVDANGVSTTYDFDSRDREVEKIEAAGTNIASKTAKSYDPDSNVTEIREPRYFDTDDSNGYQKARTNISVNGRGLPMSSTVASGTVDAATMQVTYYLDGRVDAKTDGNGFVWKSYWHSCCGRHQGDSDPAGHGFIVNNDFMGRQTHFVQVSDYVSHSNKHDPTNSKTLAEVTSSYDILGRKTAKTTWLSARGPVDENSPPIAGLDGIPSSEGITTRTLYDNNLADDIGLDSSTGVTVEKLGGGTFNISLVNALNKLADNVANGGGNTSFVSGTSAGSARVTISGEQEVAFEIFDGVGRSAMKGKVQTFSDPSPNSLITHTCNKFDSIANVVGFGNTLETWIVDASGHYTKSRTDGAGRRIEAEDQSGNVTKTGSDPNGNIKELRDSNGVGFDILYDELNRMNSKTDTWGDQLSISYYRGGLAKTKTDAKSKIQNLVYDSRGRRKTVTDRLGNSTTYSYDDNSKLLSITDSENRVTNFQYNSRGLVTRKTLPDHSGGIAGSSSYGIIDYDYDAMGRVNFRTDQLGDTVTFVYDLAGQLSERVYRSKANSPAGAVADKDEFVYDQNGRLLTAESGRYGNVASMTYDLAGRLEDESLEIGTRTYTVSREYNNLGQLAKLVYPDGTEVEQEYTDRGQLKLVKYDSTTIATRAYDDGGRLTSSVYNNGVSSTFNYRSSSGDKDNQLSSIATTNNGAEKIGTYSYAYDSNKNKIKETITGSSISNQSFDTTLGIDADGYDDEDRLTYWERSDNNRKLEWTLTDVGDWSSLKLNGVSTSRTHSNAHETTAVGSSVLTYDAKGNLTSDATKSQDYEWDFDNRMTSVDDGSTENIARYDALGRRVQFGPPSSPDTFIYAGQQVVSRYSNNASASSPKDKWVYGVYLDEPILMDHKNGGSWDKYYYSRNSQYSVTGLTNSSGNVVERYIYDAYGNTTILAPNGTTQRTNSAYNNPFMYTGRFYHEQFEIYDFRSRMFDPALGRFISRDSKGYLDGMSLYNGYFAMNGLDPSGTTTLQQPTAGTAIDSGYGEVFTNDGDTERAQSSPTYYAAGASPLHLVQMLCGIFAHDVITKAVRAANPNWHVVGNREIQTIMRMIFGRSVARIKLRPDLTMRPKRSIPGTYCQNVAFIYEIKTILETSPASQLKRYRTALHGQGVLSVLGPNMPGMNGFGYVVPRMGCGRIAWHYAGPGVINYEWITGRLRRRHEYCRYPRPIPLPANPERIPEPWGPRMPEVWPIPVAVGVWYYGPKAAQLSGQIWSAVGQGALISTCPILFMPTMLKDKDGNPFGYGPTTLEPA